MRIQLLILAVLITFSSIGQKVNKDFIDGEIYLKLKQKPSASLSSAVNVSNELGFMQKFWGAFVLQETNKPYFTSNAENLQKIYRLKLRNPENIDEILKQLKQFREVEFVEKVPIKRIIGTPNDPNAGSQWFLSKVKAFEAWDVNPGGSLVVVAVVDNAIQTNHPDLQANMLAGIDIADGDNNPNPPNALFAHGTHVAGIAGAVSNNGLGVASASNNRVKILPIKATYNTSDYRNIDKGYEGVLWAANNGANIISLSWGSYEYAQVEQELIDYAYNKGILIVAAAGNEETFRTSYPAAYKHVISVASLDSDDKRSSFSNYGNWIDVAAPGRGILSTIPFNDYALFNGTSMSTPLVSSILGYIWSCFPSLSLTQVENLMLKTADNIDAANPTLKGQLGAGRVNLLKAVSCANIGLAAVNVNANGSTNICEGQSVMLDANSGAGFSYQWFKDGQPTNITTPAYNISATGNYQVIVSKGTCSIASEIIKIERNTILTNVPTAKGKEIAYCTDLSQTGGLKATAINCDYNGPATFTYNGPMVGYDGFDKTDIDPSVNAIGLKGTLTSLKVSVTWEKKDQASKDACNLPNGDKSPYNDEVSFKIQSPSGKVVTLIASGTYSVGTHSSGVVTTVFEMGASPIPQWSIPVSGTFAPAESFATFLNENPLGKWTLLPEDDNTVDPLCVKGFAITISTNGTPQPPSITWWNAPTGGSLLGTGNEYFPATTSVGEHTYYVQATCEGQCPSPRVAVKLNVLTVPQVRIFAISASLAADTQFKEMLKKQTLSFSKNAQNQYQLFDMADPSTEYITLGENPPMSSPVTLCSTGESYLLLAEGCQTNVITWNNGANGQSLIVTPNNPIGYNAYCHKEWAPCAPISSNNILFVSPTDHVLINRKVYPNSVQTFTGKSITATNQIESPANIVYKANTSVTLNAGFSVGGNSVFMARIGGCGD